MSASFVAARRDLEPAAPSATSARRSLLRLRSCRTARTSESWARPPTPANRPAITGWRAEGDGAKTQVVFRTQFQLLF